MPSRPKRTCKKPGCPGVYDPATHECSVCGKRKIVGWKEADERGTTGQRGYDRAWQKLRAQFIRASSLAAARAGFSPYPICEECGQPIEGAIEVDHRIPFEGKHDPKRLDWNNLRCLHPDCHRRKTERDKKS